MKQKLLLMFISLSLLGSGFAQSTGGGITVNRVPDFVYTGAPITPAITLRDGQKTMQKDKDFTLEYKNNVNVGTATIVISLKGNYEGTQTREFKINKAKITVVTDAGQGKVYGQAEPTLAYKIGAGELKAKDAFTGALTRDPGENAGDYNITQGTLSAGDNYELTVIRNKFTITKAPLLIKANAGQSKVYGQKDPPLKYTLEGGSLVGKDALTGELSRSEGENAGNYPITLGSLSAGSNYDIKFTNDAFEIKKADITVRPEPNQSKVYGSPDPIFKYTVTQGAMVGGDLFRGMLGRSPGEDVGKYPITEGSLSPGPNYNMKFESVPFEIVRKTF